MVDNLRTAHVDRVRELQRKLYRKAKSEPKFRFYALYDKVYRMDVLESAWGKVKRNNGRGGVDRIEIEDISKGNPAEYLKEVQRELMSAEYKAHPLRRVYIPKPDGTERPLSIPTIKDRIVQTALKIILEPIFEADFEDNSYGFRPKRTAQQAAQEVKKYLNYGYTQVVETDIKDCFGTIPHRELISMVAKRVVDSKILRLVKMILKSGVLKEEVHDHDDKGTPQGGSISPLLANIYLDALDKGWKPLNAAARLIRYADDLVILTRYGAHRYKEKLEDMVKNLKLTLKQTKTRVVDVNTEGFDFLGYRFTKVPSWRTGRKVTYCQPSRKSEQAIRGKIRKITNHKRPVKVQQVVSELTSAVRGWVNYHRWANSRRTFDKTKWYIEQKVRKFMRRRQGKSGYGYKEYSYNYMYKKLCLYNDYRVVWANTLR